MKKSIIIILIITSLFSCKKETQSEIKKYNQLEKANWVIGEWGNMAEEAVMTEIWIKENDSTYKGKSFVTVAKDTVFYENVSLEQKNDSLFYIVSVKNQNKEEPVAFYLTKSSGKQLVFENPKHDFPNKIAYNKINNDSIVAEISGIQKGKENKESFPMKRK
jgi:Domain of unknown function (DUF6265)